MQAKCSRNISAAQLFFSKMMRRGMRKAGMSCFWTICGPAYGLPRNGQCVVHGLNRHAILPHGIAWGKDKHTGLCPSGSGPGSGVTPSLYRDWCSNIDRSWQRGYGRMYGSRWRRRIKSRRSQVSCCQMPLCRAVCVVVPQDCHIGAALTMCVVVQARNFCSRSLGWSR